MPQQERFDPPKVRRELTLRAQNARRATARAIRPTQSAQRVHFACSKCRFDPPKVRRGFTSRSQNAHRATARAIRPTQSALRVHFVFSKCAPRHRESDWTRPKCAKGSLCIFNKRTAPQREQFDPPKVLRLPRHRRELESTVSSTESARKALKCCTCHEICTKSSKVLRLSRKTSHAERSKCCACHESRL